MITITTKDGLFTYSILQDYGDVSEMDKGWCKKLTLTKWGESPPKYDIRGWKADFSRSQKGVSLSKEDLSRLKKILNSMDDI